MLHTIRRTLAFTLLELAVVLVIVSLMVGFGLQAFDKAGEQECYKVTEERLDTINRALQDFLAANKRLPKPAARTYGSSQPQFGYELATNDTALIGVNGSVLFGAIPHATLNLPIAYAADCWGNKFTYLVTNTLTSADPSTGYGSGANGTITLRSGTIAAPNTQSTEVAYAVISHGMDGFGAKPLAAGNNANDFCTVNTGKIDTENCDNANTVIFNSSRNIAKGSATYFDDLLIYSTRIKSAACESGKSVSWNGGMCSGTTSTAIANRNTGTVTNSKAGSQGSTVVTCNDGALSVTPPSDCCLLDGQNSQGSASNCCNGDSDGNGICGSSGTCMNAAVKSWACGAELDDRECPAGQKIVLTSTPCASPWVGYTRWSFTCENDVACGYTPPCTADGQPSGGNPASCCNGDSDGNGTCGTQAGPTCAAGWSAPYLYSQEASYDMNAYDYTIGFCAAGAGGSQGGHDPSTQGNVNTCISSKSQPNIFARGCGARDCVADGQPVPELGGSPGTYTPQYCCSSSLNGGSGNGDPDNNHLCGTQSCSWVYFDEQCEPYGTYGPSEFCSNRSANAYSECWVEIGGPGCGGSDVKIQRYMSSCN